MKLLLFLLGCGGVCVAAPKSPEAPETVVLLHGMGRTSFSMAPLAAALRAEGYRVVNVGYSSRRPLESLATEWLPAHLSRNGGDRASRLHFVTHSLGGILVRLWLRECGAPPNLGRVVMLAPPNAGSEVSDRLEGSRAFRFLVGVNGPRLTSKPDALPRSLGSWLAADPARASGELGIIAGDRPLNPFMAKWLPTANDGKVTVAATRLAGATDHIVVPYSHTWLGWRARTIGHVKAFLRDGRFAAGD